MLFLVLLVACCGLSSAQDPWKRLCVSEYELRIFNAKRTYREAKAGCVETGANLVKINTEDIARGIERAIKPLIAEGFYTGASDMLSEGEWIWQDGTKVRRREDAGYQNWKTGRPLSAHNKTGFKEDCMVVERKTRKWTDVDCAKARNFICQKAVSSAISGNVSLNIDRSKLPGKLVCRSSGCPRPFTTWFKNGSEVSAFANQSIYQSKSVGWATVNFDRADLQDSGEYICQVKNKHYKKSSRPQKVIVPATPTIVGLKNFSCNSTVIVSWKPNKKALKSVHQIQATGKSGTARIKHETPTDMQLRKTTIWTTEESSKITIKVKACVDSCKAGPFTTRVIDSGRTRKVVKRATVKQSGDKSTCVVSWSWQRNNDFPSVDKFLVNVRSFLASTRNGTSTAVKISSREINARSSYTFHPEPNERYQVVVRPINCDGPGDSVKAIGSCVGSPEAPSTLSMPQVSRGDAGGSFVTIDVPQEDNGLVSCIFVIISTVLEDPKKKSYNLNHLQKLNKSNLCDSDYIATVIPMSRFTNKSLQVGDGSTTSCDFYDTGNSASSSRNANGSTFVGQNRPLESNKTYRIFVASVTPSGSKLLFQSSPSTIFRSEEQSESLESSRDLYDFDLISFLLGLCPPLVVIIILIIIVFRQKKGIKKSLPTEAQKTKEPEYEVCANIEGPAYVNRESIHQYIKEPGTSQETNAYEVPLSVAQLQKTAVEPAYETYAG